MSARSGGLGQHSAIAVLLGLSSGCASTLNRLGPKALELDHLLPIVCTASPRSLSDWRGVRMRLAASRDEVLATARERLAANGYQIAREVSAAGCVQTAYKAVPQRRWEALRSILVVHPPLTGRSLVVQATEQPGVTRVAVFGIAKFGQLQLVAGHASVMGEARRLARAITQRQRKRRKP